MKRKVNSTYSLVGDKMLMPLIYEDIAGFCLLLVIFYRLKMTRIYYSVFPFKYIMAKHIKPEIPN